MVIFSVEVIFRNWQIRFLPAEERGSEVVLDALGDTGVSELCLSANTVHAYTTGL